MATLTRNNPRGAKGKPSWRVWVVNDRQGNSRRIKRRTTADNRLSPATVAKRVSVAKQLFRCAVRWGWLQRSPFDGLKTGSQANPARARYVPRETIQDVLEHCPSLEWRLVVALARYAGLRCPSEIGALTLGHVNWEKGRLTVLARKTEHHGGDHAVRIVPISPELRGLLPEPGEVAAADSGPEAAQGPARRTAAEPDFCDANCDANCDAASVRTEQHRVA